MKAAEDEQQRIAALPKERSTQTSTETADVDCQYSVPSCQKSVQTKKFREPDKGVHYH